MKPHPWQAGTTGSPPCKGCADRREGCHGVCLYYKTYRAKLDAKAATRWAEKTKLEIAWRTAYERAVRISRKKHLK